MRKIISHLFYIPLVLLCVLYVHPFHGSIRDGIAMISDETAASFKTVIFSFYDGIKFLPDLIFSAFHYLISHIISIFKGL